MEVTTYGSITITQVNDGRGISEVINYYYATQTDTETLPTAGDSAWKTEVSELTNAFGETYKYLWNYEVVSYNNGTSGDPTTPNIIGVYSKDGNGIKGIIEYYLATKTNEPPKSLPTVDNANGWTKDDGKTVLPQATKNSPYLWNYEIIDYTDGTDTTSGPVCITTYTDSVYTWIKYADDAKGTNMSDTQQVGQWYIGMAYNKDTPTPSSDPKDYIWSLIPDEPTDVIGVPQYYLKAIPGEGEDLKAPDQDDKGWSDDCPNPWASECLDGDGKSLYYVWQRTETKRTNGMSEKCQYTTPIVLSDYEVANVLAQQAGYRSVGAWCQKEGRTIIDGSTIMTGTINANRLDVNSLKVNEDFQVVITQPVKDLEIGGRNLIKLSQLTAVNCTIGATSTNNIEVSSVTSGNMAIMKINGSHEPGSYILNATGSKSNKDFRVLFDKNYDGSCTYNAYYAGHGYPYFKDYTSMPLKLTFTEATSIGLVMKSDVGAQTITGLKLEVGNTMATDWTPAPEDMATAAELKVTNDKISTKVESSTYESGLTQLTDQMVAKVHNKETGDNCSWTMNPDSFNISAVADGKEGGITVDANGLTVNGIVNAQAGGSIGGFSITENNIHAKDKTLGTDESMFLSTVNMAGGADFFKDSWGNEINDWRMTIGSNFGVTSEGYLYANQTRLKGCVIEGDDFRASISGVGFSCSSSDSAQNRSFCIIGDNGCFMFTGDGQGNEVGKPTRHMVFGHSPNGIGMAEHDGVNYTGLVVAHQGHVALRSRNGHGIALESDSGIDLNAKTSMSLTAPNGMTLTAGNDKNNKGNLVGTWRLNSSNVIVSDKNFKHNIEPLEDNYTSLFDKLQPVRFKYNDGTSDRYHTGFIAQDVCDATKNAGLTTQDFSAYVEFSNKEDNSIECGLRYDEFIALCVNEIQKLKKRVNELEEKLDNTK